MTPRERFLHYVTYYTTSDDFSETAPSTERQKELIRELAREMGELGLKDISFDSNSNVYGTLPANVKGAPSIDHKAQMTPAPHTPTSSASTRKLACTHARKSSITWKSTHPKASNSKGHNPGCVAAPNPGLCPSKAPEA